MKKYSTLLIGFLLSLPTFSQILGGEIDYRCLGNGRYEVIVYMNRYCADSIITPTIKCMIGADSLTADSTQLLSITELYPSLPKCNNLAPCVKGPWKSKISRYAFRGVFNLNAYSTCTTLFFIREETSNITTTLYKRSQFFISTEVNRCLSPCDNSPIMLNKLPFYLPHNQEAIFSLLAINSIYQTDSLVYEFAPVREDFSIYGTYSGNYSASNWSCYFGFPNQNLSWPAGLHIDPINGQLMFRPTCSNQVAALAVLIRVFRNINGIMTFIGEKSIEQTFSILPSPNNKVPKIKPPYSYQICSGQKSCFYISTEDDDMADSTDLKINLGNLYDAEITKKGFGKHVAYEVCWTPDSSHVSNVPYQFTAAVMDNACPLNWSQSKTFSFFVNARPEYSHHFNILDSGCSDVSLNIVPKPNIKGFNYHWDLLDSKGSSYLYTGLSSQKINLDLGKYLAIIQTSNSAGCFIQKSDSFQITGSSAPPYYNIDTHFIIGCEDEQQWIGIDMGASNYSYEWSDGFKGKKRLISIGMDTNAYGIAIVNGSCAAKDSIWIYSNAKPDLRFYTGWYSSNILELRILNPEPGIRYFWHIDGDSQSTAIGNHLLHEIPDSFSHGIRLVGKNFGCTTEDTFTVAPASSYTSINKLNTSEIRIYPNPFSSSIHIEGKGLIRIVLYDALGRTIQNSQAEGSTFTLESLQGLPSTIYLLKIETEDGIIIQKVVKK